MRAYVLLAGAPELPAELRILQVVERAFRALLGRGHEEARLTLCDLKRDAAHVAADERPRLPEGLRDREPEALAGRLLDHDVRLRLERVHLDRADVVQVVEDLDVGVAL